MIGCSSGHFHNAFDRGGAMSWTLADAGDETERVTVHQVDSSVAGSPRDFALVLLISPRDRQIHTRRRVFRYTLKVSALAAARKRPEQRQKLAEAGKGAAPRLPRSGPRHAPTTARYLSTAAPDGRLFLIPHQQLTRGPQRPPPHDTEFQHPSVQLARPLPNSPTLQALSTSHRSSGRSTNQPSAGTRPPPVILASGNIHRQDSSHRRRTSFTAHASPEFGPHHSVSTKDAAVQSSAQSITQSQPHSLGAVPELPSPMSLSRSPSPQPGGGWSAPGLDGAQPPRAGAKSYGALNAGDAKGGVSWASAEARSAKVSSFAQNNQNFFRRHFRTISNSLPRFKDMDFSEKEKLGRGRLSRLEKFKELAVAVARNAWRLRKQLAVMLAFILAIVLFYVTPLHNIYRRTTWLGGGKKFVVIIAANQGGGVMEWKGPREWAIERFSVRNKREYAARHGYDLEVVDMATKKKYAHEWRESWEKVDTLRRCMREYPEAEWFWWLDLNTFIMEPSLTLQHHIFNDLAANTYRDINKWNPLNISHPLNDSWLSQEDRQAEGDGNAKSISMVIPQDCDGFNLGSFFIRRGTWTDRLLDMWWDPVHYEQKHMDWDHKEQDAFEHLYMSQPWVRSRTAFIANRKVNSFPPGACGDGGNSSLHYSELDRDFMVNMAGCEWGRDCWAEIYNYRELSNKLNRTLWEKFKDGLSDLFKAHVKPLFVKAEAPPKKP